MNFIGEQNHIVNIDQLCYKPIATKGCLVTSPLDYWKKDKKRLINDPDVKETSLCLGSDDDTETPCADQNGIPVIKDVVLGGTTCVADNSYPCGPCRWNASALFVTYLLNNDIFTLSDAEDWEKNVFEKSIDDFNK